MKTIAYSEVPQTHSNVHLACISASSSAGDAALGTGLLGAVSFLLVALAVKATKLDLKFPQAWRLLMLTVVTVAGCLVSLGIFALLSR